MIRRALSLLVGLGGLLAAALVVGCVALAERAGDP